MLAATRERARATASQNNTYCTYCRMCTYCRVACCIVVFGHMCAHQSLIYQDGFFFIARSSSGDYIDISWMVLPPSS